MNLRPLTENESAIVEYYGANRLATVHKKNFSNTSSFMNAWIQHRSPQWKDVIVGDRVQLTTKTNRADVYYVAYISLEKDEIQFSKSLTSNRYPKRLISDMPYMKVIQRAPRKVESNSLF